MRQSNRTSVAGSLSPARVILWMAALVVAVVIVGTIGAGAASAETFTVDTLQDGNDDDPNNGDCESAEAGGDCTLRAAIEVANALDGADTVTFSVTGTIELTEDDGTPFDEELEISEDLTIDGPGEDQLIVEQTVDQERVFFVDPGVNALIRGITVTGANADETGVGGGGIFTEGTLTLTGVTVSDNFATFGGGGIFNAGGTMTLIGTTVTGNTAGGNGSGFYTSGGTVTLTDSTVSNNTQAADGGGFFNTGAVMTLTGSTVSDNSAVGDGAGFYNDTGDITLDQTTVSGNVSDDNGGGIENSSGTVEILRSTIGNNEANNGGGISNEVGGTVTVDRSTVSGNEADFLGGGIENASNSLEGGASTLMVQRSTVSNNRAGNGAGIYSDIEDATQEDSTAIVNSTISGNEASGIGGGVENNSGLTTISFTTITDNTAPENEGAGVATGGDTSTEVGSSIIAANNGTDVNNSFQSEGYNVIGDGAGADDFNGPNDVTGISNPLLGPLANNGGFTQTHALQSGSPALNRVAQSECPPPNIDQRGGSRPQGPRCDSGSIEKEVTPPPADKANLSLTKKASKGRPTVGDKLTYTLRVKNNGPDRATRVKIVDTLPKGVKVLSTSKGCRKLTARKVRCNISRLADGRSVAKKIRVKVNRSGKLVNKARASSSVRDPNGRNNSARAVVRAKPKAEAKAAPRFKQISCRVKDPTVRLVQGKQVLVAKPGTACVIQGNQLALARSLKNQSLGLVKRGGAQVRAAKGKVMKSGARKVVVRVPRGF
ncbi:MAG: choice-of-anchor Q domain-containing protein [Rubrobacteraceae bacterium]